MLRQTTLDLAQDRQIKFTHKFSNDSINFLDTSVKIDPNIEPYTTLYEKPTDTHLYLYYASAIINLVTLNDLLENSYESEGHAPEMKISYIKTKQKTIYTPVNPHQLNRKYPR